MSSTEPPSRSGPRNSSQENKTLRDELISKGRVEKVRAVDADEETRKNQFLKYYKDDQTEEEQANADKPPTPLDLYSEGSSSSLGDVEDAIIPSPAYSPPPDVHSLAGIDDDTATTDALPQSDDFWDDFSLPDDPKRAPNLQENPPKKTAAPHKKGKAEEKKTEPSPFGPPGKFVSKTPVEKNKKPKEKELSPFAIPSPEEEEQKPLVNQNFRARPVEKQKRMDEPPKAGKKAPNQKEIEDLPQGPASLHFNQEERQGGGKKGGEPKTLAMEGSFEPAFPPAIQPLAAAATTQAAPYLSPSTMNLFFQMVGTMYIMAGPQGISRTEILLNNPAFASSKFFGSIITIEKYATAPDSFNIRLTGSNQQAVVSFKENIPSLMNAFQNGNFSFRVNRIDVEYTTERPIFRRKEKGEGRGETDGGDLRERRK